MALGYVCANCGWSESTHIFGGNDINGEDRQRLDEPLLGSDRPFRFCQKYQPSVLEKFEIELLNARLLHNL